MKKPIQIESITEVRSVDPESLKCGLCRMTATLNAAGHCTHCRHHPRPKDLARIGEATVSGPTIWGSARQMVRNALTSCGLLPRTSDAEPLTMIK